MSEIMDKANLNFEIKELNSLTKQEQINKLLSRILVLENKLNLQRHYLNQKLREFCNNAFPNCGYNCLECKELNNMISKHESFITQLYETTSNDVKKSYNKLFDTKEIIKTYENILQIKFSGDINNTDEVKEFIKDNFNQIIDKITK